MNKVMSVYGFNNNASETKPTGELSIMMYSKCSFRKVKRLPILGCIISSEGLETEGPVRMMNRSLCSPDGWIISRGSNSELR